VPSRRNEGKAGRGDPRLGRRAAAGTEDPTPLPGQPRGRSSARPSAAHEKRKAEILQAAGEVFYEKGYHAASMQDIAERVAMLKAGLYYYIASKEDVLYELAVGLLDEALHYYLDADALLEDADGETRLNAFIARWMERIAGRNPALIAVEREYRQLTPEHLAHVIERRRRLRALVEDILEQGIREGTVDPAVNLPVAVTNIFELLLGWYVWYRPGGASSLEQLAEWYTAFIHRGLSPTPR
jgi:AcrR family transcriptional regulator